MSLLDGPAPAHAPALMRVEARLRAGNEEERAVLLNLIEEDRVPDSGRAMFHLKLASSTRRAWRDRLVDATRATPRLLAVATPRPAAIQGAWWTHVPLRSLQKNGYVSLSLKAARPPRRVRLQRPLGRAASGFSFSTWITNKTGTNAEDLRDRLGLWFVARGEELYRIRFGVGTAPSRPLYIPTALDAGWYPAWRRPDPGHVDPWGMTRHLVTDAPSQHELLALPHIADDREAHYVGPILTDPPRGFFGTRRLP